MAFRARLKRPEYHSAMNVSAVLAFNCLSIVYCRAYEAIYLHVFQQPFLLFPTLCTVSSSSVSSIRQRESGSSFSSPTCRTRPLPTSNPQQHHPFHTLLPKHHQRNRPPLLPSQPSPTAHPALGLPHRSLRPRRLPQRHAPRTLGPQLHPPRRIRIRNLLHNPGPCYGHCRWHFPTDSSSARGCAARAELCHGEMGVSGGYGEDWPEAGLCGIFEC